MKCEILFIEVLLMNPDFKVDTLLFILCFLVDFVLLKGIIQGWIQHFVVHKIFVISYLR